MFQSLPPEEVHAIAREYFQTCINQTLEWCHDLPLDESDIEHEIELLNADMASARDALKQRKFASPMVVKADELLAAHMPASQKRMATRG